MINNLNGKRISIIGAGVSGCAVAKVASAHGADVFVSDGKEIPDERKRMFAAENISWEENGNSSRVLECDEIVVSSGIPPYIPIIKAAEEHAVRLTGELDFAANYLKGKIIAVTGSNGKTTTCSVIGGLLKKSGYNCAIAGNIGVGVAELADKEFDYIAMELSSFQLYWSTHFKCDAAVITNLAPDHINWHGSYENYIAAKANLFRCLKENGAAICQKRDTEVLRITKGTDIYRLGWEEDCRIFLNRQNKAAYLDSDELFSFADVNLLGDHNMENLAMALAAVKLAGATVNKSFLAELKAPEHRCEYVGETNGIVFVNDSKGTNVAASVTAMSSLQGSKIIILGGQGKGEEYGPLAETVCKYVKSAVIIGSEKEKIARALDDFGYVNYQFAEDMGDAVRKAYEKADNGDMVLLSPACTSWDMYPNFETRGEDFRAKAMEIINKN